MLDDYSGLRALTPDRPVLRGTAQNPDAFFQAREACNRFYSACPSCIAARRSILTGLDPQVLIGAAEDPFSRAVVLVNQDLGQTLASVLKEQAVEARVDPSAAILLGQVDRTFIYALPPVNP